MNRRYLTITTVLIVTAFAVMLIVFSPGYIEYQQIRWRTQLKPERIEAGMTGMLAATKAMEGFLGHRNLSSEDFRSVSADNIREMQKMAEYNDLAMLLRIGYLNRLLDDPSGEELKQQLFEEIAKDVSDRIDDRSNIAKKMRVSAYRFAVRDPRFEKLLLTKIGNLDRLGVSREQVETIRSEQGADGRTPEAPRSPH